MNKIIFLLLLAFFYNSNSGSFKNSDYVDVPDCYKIKKPNDSFSLNKLLVKSVYDLVHAAEIGRDDDVQKLISYVNFLTFDNLRFKLIEEKDNKELFKWAEVFYLGPQSALITASQLGHLKIVKKLLDAKADMNIQDWCGKTALMAACYAGHESIIDELLKRGADVNVNNDGFTALRCTGQAYIDFEVKKRILIKLLKAGANPALGTPFYDVPIELNPVELKQIFEQHQKHSAEVK